MSKQANTTAIGAFTLGALALAVTGVMIFGSGKFFTERKQFVLFFEGSVKGLNVGATVDFKGVKVGAVTDIKVLFDTRDLSLRIPVFIAIEPDRLTELSTADGEGRAMRMAEEGQIMDALVAKGLRAQLAMQSLVTGLLYVDLDFHPDKAPRLTGMATGYPEIPTIASRFEELSRTLKALPLDELAEKLLSAIEGIEQFVNSPHLKESVSLLNQALKDIQTLARNLDHRVDTVSTALEATLGDARSLMQNLNGRVGELADEAKLTLKSTHSVMTGLDRRVGPLANSLENTLESARRALKQAERTLAHIEDLTGENSAFRYELSQTFREIEGAARSIRQLGDTLQRHPEAVIRGKKNDKGE